MSEVTKQKILVGGEWIDSNSERFEEITDPTTNDVIAHVPLCGEDEINKVIQVAKEAFPAWRDTPVAKRAAYFFKLQQILIREQENIAEIISKEHGKVFSDAMGSIRRGIDIVEFAAGMPTLLQGQTIENISKDIDCNTYRQPLGVCAAITPFNFPAMVPMWFAPIAIAAGNTFVLKPSEKTSLSTLKIAECFQEAGLPDGVFNVVTGDKEAVDALLHNYDVKAISFVGSTPVGKYIYEEGSKNGKRVQALTGAKNHMVVMPDADLEQAVSALIGSVFGSAGERCMAISVCVAVGDVSDKLIPKLVERAKSLKVGPGTEKSMEMGPLVTKEHLNRVVSYIGKGIEEGASLILDGRDLRVEGYPNGNWLGPTIFDYVTPQMTIYREEIFGPVLCVLRVDTLQDAIDLINNHRFGNGTAIFTDSGKAARDFRTNVNVGMIGLNVPIPVPMAYFSFTGWKDSFFGTLHAHGKDGVLFYTEQKIVTSKWFGSQESSSLKMSI